MTATAQTTATTQTAHDSATFYFSPEQDGLRAATRAFLADRSTEQDVRRVMATADGVDPAVWATMADQLGLQGLAVPEVYGGAGAGVVELQVVAEEMGRALLCAPYLASSVLATSLLVAMDDAEASARWLPGLADGSVVATLAIVESDGSWDPADVRMTSEQTADGWVLHGTKHFVLDGGHADLVLVAAPTPDGLGVFAVTDGFGRTPMDTLDETRKQAVLTFDGTPATRLRGDAAAALGHALDLTAAVLSAEQAGGARRVLDMAVAYATVREQFGRPIGSYQAIKHKCANMLLEVETAVSAAYAAGWAIDGNAPDAPVLASLAKAYCSEAYYRCAAENIQVHGGIGFTWEHPAHLYFKRATSTQALLGSPRHHREQLVRRLGL